MEYNTRIILEYNTGIILQQAAPCQTCYFIKQTKLPSKISERAEKKRL